MKRKFNYKKKGRTGEPNELENKVLSSVRRRDLSIVSEVGYETEKLNYVLEKNYWPDITITLTDGRKIYVECKGWFRPEDRTKMLAVKVANPETDIRFVFPRDNKLNKNTETTYSQWCERHGFPYHIGTEVPKAWLK